MNNIILNDHSKIANDLNPGTIFPRLLLYIKIVFYSIIYTFIIQSFKKEYKYLI